MFVQQVAIMEAIRPSHIVYYLSNVRRLHGRIRNLRWAILPYQVSIMETDPLLGFENSERDALKDAAPFLATNPRKLKRVRPCPQQSQSFVCCAPYALAMSGQPLPKHSSMLC